MLLHNLRPITHTSLLGYIPLRYTVNAACVYVNNNTIC